MIEITPPRGVRVLELKYWGEFTNRSQGGDLQVSKALKQRGLWLTLTYVGLILLMARAYA